MQFEIRDVENKKTGEKIRARFGKDDETKNHLKKLYPETGFEPIPTHVPNYTDQLKDFRK